MRVASINGKRYILVTVDNYSRFTWVRFLKTKDEAPATIIKCIKNIQVRLNATIRNVRTDNGTEFVNQTLHEFFENVGISHQTSVARTPQHNGVVERRNQTLVEAARTMLIFSKAPLFLWAKAINTACYTQNRQEATAPRAKVLTDSLVSTSIDQDALLISIPSSQEHEQSLIISQGFEESPKTLNNSILGTRLQGKTLATYSYMTRFKSFPEAAAPRAEVLADSPVSTSIDQDASSTSIPSSQEHVHSTIIAQGFKELPKTQTFYDDLLNESPSEDSTPQGSSSNVRQIHTPFEHLGRWTKDHPIANVIGDPSRSVSTRKQLETDVMWCYFDAFLTSVEPKNFKQAMTEPSWIDAMQEEIHEFERLKV
ncbi:retrovirus-related pol polyprotein from transposon TNT 1-94 [Tanacetum coccineum]